MLVDNHTHLFSKQITKDYFSKVKTNFVLVIVDPDELYQENKWNLFTDFIKQEKDLGVIGAIPYQANMSEIQVQDLISDMEERLAGNRIYGVKLYPGYHQFYPFEKPLSFLYEYCIKKDIPVVFHSGDFDDPSGIAKMKYSMPIHIDEIAANFSDLKIVISHFGNPWFWETVAIIGHKKNVYTDISGFFWEYDPIEPAKKFYVNKLKELATWNGSLTQKLMFGTDYCGESSPLKYTQPYLDLVTQAFPDQKDQNLIFFENACKVYNLKL